MTADEKKILEGFLSKTLKMDSEGFATLYNEAGELQTMDTSLKAHEEKQAKIKSENEAQYKRGIKEQALKLEKELKAKYDIESDSIGAELVEEIISRERENAKETSRLSDDDIEKHPTFLNKRREFEKVLKQKEQDYQQKVQETEQAMRYEQTLAKVKGKAIAELKSMGAVFPEDPLMTEEWEKVFINALTSSYKFAEDKDEIGIMDADGKPLQDEHANLMNFGSLVETVGKKYFQFKKGESRSSAGNNQTGTYQSIRNQEDYLKRMREAKTPQERAEIVSAYQGQQGK